MPTTTLTMLAIGTHNGWTLAAGADKVSAINVDDGATSFLASGTPGTRQSFTLTGWQDIPSTALVTKVEHVMRGREEVGAHTLTIRPALLLGGVSAYGTDRNPAGSFTLYTEEIARPSGGGWSKDDLTTLQWLIDTGGSADGHAEWVTWGKVDVTWTNVVEIPQHTHVASHRLLQRTFDDHRHELRVPLWVALKLELLDPFNVSHDALLRAKTHLEGLSVAGFTVFSPENLSEHQLFDRWRRQLVDLVGATVHYREREATLTFLDMEKFIATYFCSERIVTVSADVYPGIVQMDVGGKISCTRSSRGYVIQSNDIITTQSFGVFVGEVLPHVPKRNHLGLLCEGAIANKIVNPAFASGLTSWTTATAGGGSVTVVTNRLALPGQVTGNSIEVIGAAASENSFRQVIAVLSADAFMRLMFIFSSRQNGNPNWKIERSFDSKKWDDAGNAWSASDVWNGTPAGWDAVNGLEIVKVFWSKPIPVQQNENWTIRLGKLNAAETYNFYVANLTVGKLRWSPLVDTATTAADEVKDVLDAGETGAIGAIDWSAVNTMMYKTGALAGAVNGPRGTLVAWVKLLGGDGTLMTVLTNNGREVELTRTAANKYRVELDNAGSTTILDILSSSTFVSGSGWKCLMVSWDLGVVPRVRFRIGDANELGTVTTLAAGDVNYQQIDWGFASDYNLAQPLNGSTSDFWFSFDEFIDFDIEANRRKFFSASGQAVWLGLEGELPTTRVPELYFYGDNTTYNSNDGTSSDFTYNGGTPANDGSPPSRGVGGDVRQLHWAGHGTIEVSYLAEQDVADLPDPVKLCLVYIQYGTSGKDYDAVTYEVSGATHRFTYERWRDIAGTSTLDQSAIFNVDLVRGTTYHIAARSVGLDQELSLAVRTMVIRVNGVNGPTTTATAHHSESERHTELWTGCAPAVTGFSRSMGYVYDVRANPRVLADEECRQ